MPKYASYPVITSLSANDIVLVHQDSSNAEKTILFDDLQVSVLATLPIPTLTAATTITASDNLIVDDGGVTKKIAFSDFWPAIPVATGSTSGLLSASDKTMLNDANVNASPNSLVIRESDGSGKFVRGTFSNNVGIGGALTVGNPAFPGTLSGDISAQSNLQVGGEGDFSGDLSTTARLFVSSDSFMSGDATVSGTCIPSKLRISKGVSGLRTIDTETKIIASYVFTGGAPTENFTIGLFGPASFSTKPNWGIVIPTDPHYTATFLQSDPGNSTVTAVAQLSRIDGTNIPSGTKFFYCIFTLLTA